MSWNDDLSPESPAYKLAISNDPIIRSLAGPGTGKSFAIKRRIARLIESGTDPKKILAITFTRTAAADLKKEISTIELPDIEKVTAKTVHSHAMSIIMRSEVKEYTKRNPRMIIEHEIEPAFRDIQFPEGSNVRDRKELLETYLSAWANLQTDDPGMPHNPIESEFQKQLVNWLTYHQAVLVGEVMPIALIYLKNNPASSEIGKFDTILVDEYQDLNRAEQEFIRLIRGSANIVIVGDDDQSIYSFKHAHPDGIKKIDELYGAYTDINFDTIRRCPKIVTTMASALIAKNSNRSLGQLIPYEKNQDGIVQIIQWNDNEKEVYGIAKIIVNEINEGKIKPGDVLVLAPRRLIGYKLRDILLLEEIPVKSYFRESVIKNENVKRAYSMLFLAAFPEDRISLRYLLGTGASDYREKQYKILKEYSDANTISIREVLNQIIEGKIKLKGILSILNRYRDLLEQLALFKDKLINDTINAFEYFVKESDEIEFYEIINTYQSIVENKPLEDAFSEEQFIEWLKSTVTELTEAIALPDSPEEIDHVRIMSLHASKGLNAKFVLLISMIDEFMPFVPTNTKNEIKAIEEQRRLFYVAMTRCKSSEKDYPGRLIISSYIWIHGIEACRMGLPANPKKYLKVSSTRFLNDFGRSAPRSISGNSLLN